MVTSSARTIPAATSQCPLTPNLSRGLSLRSPKSQRWICDARASTEKVHCPGGVTARAPASDEPLFSDPARVKTPHTVIPSAQQPEHIRERDFPPVHHDLRGPKPSRSSRDVSLHAHGSRGLQHHASAPGLRLQVQPPAAWRNLVHAPRNCR